VAALAEARRRWRPIGRGLLLNRISAWSLAVFAGISALLALVSGLVSGPGVIGPAVAAALGLLSWSEFAAGARMRRLDERGPRRMAINQLVLGGLVGAYCGHAVWRGLYGPDPLGLASASPEVREVLDVDGLDHAARAVVAAVYSAIGGLALVIQALAAWYFSTLTRRVREYAAQTPAWIVDARRCGVL
jgi:hypothetical protein